MLEEEFLRRLAGRQDAGQPISQIADELCVSRQAVEQWLSRATRPSRVVMRLAELLWGADWPLD